MTSIILGLWMWSAIVRAFDPTKIDYCNEKCPKENSKVLKHIACGFCPLAEGHTEILEELQKFRERMVETHNEARSKIASGDEEAEFGFPGASNMRAISYDLEMEYIARCQARRHLRKSPVKFCRTPHGYPGAGLNSYLSYKLNNDDPVSHWYKNIKNVTGNKEEFLAKYVSRQGLGSLSQVVWAKVSKLGCARVRVSEEKMPFVFICIYADMESVGLTNGEVVYKVGTACSDCPSDCNKEYRGLCGEVVIPTDAPYEMKPIKNGTKDREDGTKDKEDDTKDKEDGTKDDDDDDDDEDYDDDDDGKETTTYGSTRDPKYVSTTNYNYGYDGTRDPKNVSTTDYDYGYDGLDVGDSPRNDAEARITSNIIFLSVVMVVVLWFK